MKPTESVDEFFRRHGQPMELSGLCTVFRIEGIHRANVSPRSRRDFYKVMLLTQADGRLHYAHQAIEVHDNALVFTNPLMPYYWERVAGSEAGYVCLFTEEFITPQLKTAGVAGSPLFQAQGHPVLYPPEPTGLFLRRLFEQMLLEMKGHYVSKHELLRNYLQIILHESLKLVPAAPASLPGTSSARLTALFLNLLGQQFPITSVHRPLALKNAGEFARQLAVHPNQLNRAVKETTGKTTTELVADHVLQEAKALLRHSDWLIADVAHCLGFDHAANFIIFFKRHTQITPAQFRRQPVMNS
jgi:AraC family transcriptional activator of pobA